MKVGVEEVNLPLLVAAVPLLPGGAGPSRLVAAVAAAAGRAEVAEKEAVAAIRVTVMAALTQATTCTCLA